jgi:DNA-binding transcriptional LysR family regulator
LGVTLFHRSGPRLVLTELGANYYRDVALSLDRLQEVSIDAVRGRTVDSSLMIDLPRNFHPTAIRASAFLIRSQTLDHRRLEFSGLFQEGGLVAPPEFTNEIGTLLPIAP